MQQSNFIVLVKKSNISIEQCALGFRFINILNNFGIGESDDNSIYDDENDKKKTNMTSTMNFSLLYKKSIFNVKALGLPHLI